MDVLGNIWNLFTTENEIITKYFTIPTIPIEAYLLFQLAESILKLDLIKKNKLLYILYLSLISLITKFFIPTPLNILFNYFSMLIVIKVLFKTNFIKTILCMLIPSVTFALVGVLILKPLLIILQINVKQISYIPLYRLLYLFISYIIVFILIQLIHNFNFKFIFKEDFNNKNRKVILLNLILGFFMLCVQLIITTFYTDLLPANITFLSFISLFAYFFISFYSLTRTMKLQITTSNLESAENYNTTLSYLYDNVKAFHHDFDNMLFIIGGFIDNNDIEGLKIYYKNLEQDGERVNNIALLNPKLINNSGIYNLLMAKYKKAHDVNVEIKLEFFFDFNRLNMPIYEFSRILGILLDNSIEAAQDTSEKQVHILFRDSSINHTQIVSIENTYINKDVNKTKIFEKGVTGKENHTGMGLWEVNQILRRNNNVKLTTDNNDNYFKQTLEIYY